MTTTERSLWGAGLVLSSSLTVSGRAGFGREAEPVLRGHSFEDTRIVGSGTAAGWPARSMVGVGSARSWFVIVAVWIAHWRLVTGVSRGVVT